MPVVSVTVYVNVFRIAPDIGSVEWSLFEQLSDINNDMQQKEILIFFPEIIETEYKIFFIFAQW